MTLKEFFSQNPSVALAFSGGTDSSYLLYEAIKNGVSVRAYYVRTAFQPCFETEDARRLASELGADLAVIDYDILSSDIIAVNSADRCYHCKTALFGEICRRASADGYHTVIDGTNASDDSGDRPGMRALQELHVRSPLRECGLTKDEIRRLSREAGLFTADKPAYACLATRIPTGTTINKADLARVEAAEDALSALGFSDFRVRLIGNTAKLQLRASDFSRAAEKREELFSALSRNFSDILLDLKAR
ncbi:MAG: ATP-dependent sacrificial sulfur transferase LarE [Eubacteriales bacterium]